MWRRIWRWLGCRSLYFGHKLYVIGRCGHATDHIRCDYCGKEWGMNHDVRAILPWEDVAAFHREVFSYDDAKARWRFIAWQLQRY